MNLDERLQNDLSPDIYCLVHNKIINLEQQIKKQQEVIDRIEEFIKELYDNTDDTTCYDIDKNRKVELLDILKEASE